MSASPFFTVIVPVYNREAFIIRALDSLMAQTFKDFETLVIDDASSDQSVALALAHPLPAKRVLQNPQNMERCATRNRGIEAAAGQYICFLDSDDAHLPHHLETLYQHIQAQGNPRAFFFTHAYDEDAHGVRTPRTCPLQGDMDWKNYFLRYTVNPQRWAVHRDLMLAHRFDPDIPICEDMDTSLRMVAAGVPIFQIPEITTVYVAAPDSFTHGASDKWERELTCLQKIFKRPELQPLPRDAKNRLLSMCYFHLAQKAFQQQQWAKVRSLGWTSWKLFPAGYNGRTNKPLVVMLAYALPVIGPFLRFLIGFAKKLS